MSQSLQNRFYLFYPSHKGLNEIATVSNLGLSLLHFILTYLLGSFDSGDIQIYAINLLLIAQYAKDLSILVSIHVYTYIFIYWITKFQFPHPNVTIHHTPHHHNLSRLVSAPFVPEQGSQTHSWEVMTDQTWRQQVERPLDEEPHIRRLGGKRGRHVEYIVRVDLV